MVMNKYYKLSNVLFHRVRMPSSILYIHGPRIVNGLIIIMTTIAP